MLTQTEGRAGAFVRVIFRLRLILLLVLGAAVFVALPLALPGWLQNGNIPPAATALFLSFALSYAHFRHIPLAFLVAVAPLCGTILILGAGAFLRTEFMVLGYVMGLSAGIFIADALTGTVATGVHRSDAARASFAAHIPPLFAALLFTALPGMIFFLREGSVMASASATLLLAAPTAMALLIVPMAGSFLRYGENFLDLTSRLQERHQRLAEIPAILAEPRWALSLTGVAMVLTILFASGAPAIDLSSTWEVLIAGLLLLVVAATLAARRWRAALALSLCLLICLFAGLATAGRLSLQLWAVIDILAAAGCAAFLSLALVAWRFYLSERDGDEPDAARIHAATRLIPPLLLSAALSLVIFPLWYGQLNILVVLATLMAGYVAGMFGVAAVTGALENLIPRRRSVDSLYRG